MHNKGLCSDTPSPQRFSFQSFRSFRQVVVLVLPKIKKNKHFGFKAKNKKKENRVSLLVPLLNQDGLLRDQRPLQVVRRAAGPGSVWGTAGTGRSPSSRHTGGRERRAGGLLRGRRMTRSTAAAAGTAPGEGHGGVSHTGLRGWS